MKKAIPYALYTLLCCAACYVAAMLHEELTSLIGKTYQIFPWALLIFLIYALLGAMWCGESIWARHVNGIVVGVTRVVAILLLLFLGLGWYFGLPLNAVAYSGSMPLFALLAGYLFVRLFRIRSTTAE